jgi:hypothetical protein
MRSRQGDKGCDLCQWAIRTNRPLQLELMLLPLWVKNSIDYNPERVTTNRVLIMNSRIRQMGVKINLNHAELTSTVF